MDDNKINFICPSTAPLNFVCPPITTEMNLTNFQLTPRQVPISQIYPSTRKIKHPSFRTRVCSGTMPYYIPFKHRQRSCSENADDQNSHRINPPVQESSMDCENISDKNLGMEMEASNSLQQNNSNPQFNKIKSFQLKKSKSLENLLMKTTPVEPKVIATTNSSTLEFPTLLHRIQKLKFNE